MRYVGGKSKLAKSINEIVRTKMDGCHTYLEPFMGGGATLARNAPMFKYSYASDIVPDLVMMWQEVQRGWLPEGNVCDAVYESYRNALPSAMRGFVGFGCSFGGKWFGGRARGGFNKDVPRNHAAESARAVAKLATGIKTVTEIRLADYREWEPKSGWVVYCDPPYSDTQSYGAAGSFNTNDFWVCMETWHSLGAVVLVSEYTAPDGWVPALTQSHTRSLQHGRDGRHKTTEYVWVKE